MDLSDWRARIDTVDRILLDLINRRLEYAEEIGQIKRAHGREVRDEGREREVIEGLTAQNGGPLTAAAVADIFNRIMAEARQLEGGDLDRRNRRA